MPIPDGRDCTPGDAADPFASRRPVTLRALRRLAGVADNQSLITSFVIAFAVRASMLGRRRHKLGALLGYVCDEDDFHCYENFFPGVVPPANGSCGAYADACAIRVGPCALQALKSGAYTVSWVAVAEDGHRTQGHYRFTVK